MKNTYTTAADFWKERDFGAKISATFEFISAHWRPLGKCLLYFVLPGALLMGIGLGLFTNSMYNQMGDTMGGRTTGWHSTVGGPSTSPFGSFNIGGMVLGMIASLVSFLLLVGSVYGYLRARLHLPAATPITPAVVWAEIKSRLGRMLLVIVLVGVAYVAVVGGAVAVIALFARSGSGAVFSGVVGVPLIFCLVIYLAIVLSLFFPVLWFEEGNVFTTVARCFQLIKGRWWATFGLLVVVGIIQGAMSFVFIIPQYAVMIGKMMHVPGLSSDVLGLVAQCIYAVGIMFTYTVPLLALAFQYFHLAEQKEGWGLRLLVDALGQPQVIPVAQSGHYRPDDEGEY
jgi:hypothetical protein